MADAGYRVGLDVFVTPSSLRSTEAQINGAFGRFNPNLSKIDKFNNAIGRITGNATEFQKSLDAATARVFAFGAAVGVINAVVQSFKNLVTTTIEVEKRLIEINSIFGATTSEFAKFRTEIFNVAKNTGQDFKTVSDAAAELARQGLSAADTADRLNASLILTRVGALDSVKAVESLTAAINGFASAGLSANEIVNKIVAVDTAFAVSAGDLAEGFARVGSTAEDAGVSFDQLLGLITAVQQRTSRGGAVIGNAFKSIFTRLSRSDTIDQLQQLGVEIDAAQDGVQKLNALSNALERISDPTVASKIKELAGGVFQINVVSAALKDLSSDTSIFAKAATTASNATDEAFQKNAALNKSLSAQINSLVVGLSNLAEKIGQIAVTPIFQDLISFATKLTDVLNNALSGEKAQKLIEFFFKTIGNFVNGPGLAILAAGFVKVFSFVRKFAGEALKEVIDLGGQNSRIKDIQAGIVQLLQQDENFRNTILSTTVSQAQKEQAVIKAIERENAALQFQKTLVSQIAQLASAKGVFNFNPNKGFTAKGGKIPNFAKSPLEQAIDREKKAGVPVSKIRVNADQRLISASNPLGLAVTNTRDEPNGLRDVFNKGRVPNYAPLRTGAEIFGRVAPKSQADIALDRATKSLASKIIQLQGQLFQLSRSVDETTKSLLVSKGQEAVQRKAIRDSLTSSPIALPFTTLEQRRIREQNRQRAVLEQSRLRDERIRERGRRVNNINSLLGRGAAQARQRLSFPSGGRTSRAIDASSLLAFERSYSLGGSAQAQSGLFKRQIGGFSGASNRLVSGTANIGGRLSGALGGFGLIGALGGTQLIEDTVLANTDAAKSMASLNAQLDNLTKKLEEAKEAQDEQLIASLTKDQQKLNREYQIAEQEQNKLSSSLNKLSAGFNAAAFIVPQLLGAGGKIASGTGIGLLLAAAAGAGIALGKFADKMFELSPRISEAIIEATNLGKLEQENAALNQKELAASAELSKRRLSEFSSNLENASKILSTDFVATVRTIAFSNVRGAGGRAASRFGSFGPNQQLKRSGLLDELAQEFLPEGGRRSGLEQAKIDSEIASAEIQQDINDLFDKLAEGFGSFTDETELSEQKLKKLEDAFRATIGGIPFERALGIFSKTRSSKDDVIGSLRGDIAREILSIRSGDNAFGERFDLAKSIERAQQSTRSSLSRVGSLSPGQQEAGIKELINTGEKINKLADVIGISNFGSATETFERAVAQDAENRRSIEEAAYRDQLELLNKQKEIQDNFVEDLKSAFEGNIENITGFNPRGGFPSNLTSINTLLDSLGLNVSQRGGILSGFGAGNVDATRILANTSQLIDSLNRRTQAGVGIGSGEIGLIRSQIDLAGARRRIESISSQGGFAATSVGRGGINQLLDFVNFLQSGSITPQNLVSQIGAARGAIGNLEGLQTAGRVSEQDVNNLAVLIANLVKSLGGVTGTAGFNAEEQTQTFFSNQVGGKAGDVKGLADEARAAALAAIQQQEVVLRETQRSVVQNVIDSGNEIADSLSNLSAAIQIKVGEIIRIPVPKGETVGGKEAVDTYNRAAGIPSPSTAGASSQE